jgi:hypothetical protein
VEERHGKCCTGMLTRLPRHTDLSIDCHIKSQVIIKKIKMKKK